MLKYSHRSVLGPTHSNVCAPVGTSRICFTHTNTSVSPTLTHAERLRYNPHHCFSNSRWWLLLATVWLVTLARVLWLCFARAQVVQKRWKETGQEINLSLTAVKEKWESARYRFHSERRPLVVAVLYVHANVKHGWTRVLSEGYILFERNVSIFILSGRIEAS